VLGVKRSGGDCFASKREKRFDASRGNFMIDALEEATSTGPIKRQEFL